MNPLFNSYQQNRSNQQNGNGFGGFDLNAELQNIAQQIAPTGLSPEQFVRAKIQNGEMSQEQFNQYAKIADRLMGRGR